MTNSLVTSLQVSRLLAAVFFLLPSALLGITVTNTNDTGPGSLRRAVVIANLAPGPNTIEFALGSGAQTITLTSGAIEITDELTITGPADFADHVRISGNNSSGIFEIRNTTAPIVLENLTVRDGGATGIIAEAGTDLRLNNCAIRDNDSAGGTGFGGGLYANGATVVAENCTFQANQARSGGGVMIGGSGDVTLLNATVHGNEAENHGGGMFVSLGTLTMIIPWVAPHRRLVEAQHPLAENAQASARNGAFDCARDDRATSRSQRRSELGT